MLMVGKLTSYSNCILDRCRILLICLSSWSRWSSYSLFTSILWSIYRLVNCNLITLKYVGDLIMCVCVWERGRVREIRRSAVSKWFVVESDGGNVFIKLTLRLFHSDMGNLSDLYTVYARCSQILRLFSHFELMRPFYWSWIYMI